MSTPLDIAIAAGRKTGESRLVGRGLGFGGEVENLTGMGVFPVRMGWWSRFLGTVQNDSALAQVGSALSLERVAVPQGGSAVSLERVAVPQGGSAVSLERVAVPQGGSAVSLERVAVPQGGSARGFCGALGWPLTAFFRGILGERRLVGSGVGGSDF